jgi:hypothetical protein
MLLLLHWWRCCVHVAVERLLGDEVVWLLHFLRCCWLLIEVLRVVREGHLNLMSSLYHRFDVVELKLMRWIKIFDKKQPFEKQAKHILSMGRLDYLRA